MEIAYRFQSGSFLIVAEMVEDIDVDTSFDDTTETADKIASGEWKAFGTIVKVIDHHGVIIGETSLWGSIYADPSDFFTDHRSADPANRNCSVSVRPDGSVIGHYFPDMVREAVRQARERLREWKSTRVRAA